MQRTAPASSVVVKWTRAVAVAAADRPYVMRRRPPSRPLGSDSAARPRGPLLLPAVLSALVPPLLLGIVAALIGGKLGMAVLIGAGIWETVALSRFDKLREARIADRAIEEFRRWEAGLCMGCGQEATGAAGDTCPVCGRGLLGPPVKASSNAAAAPHNQPLERTGR